MAGADPIRRHRRRPQIDTQSAAGSARARNHAYPDERRQGLNRKQRSTLAQLKKDNETLYTAYLLKEQLRAVF